jgi:hypothetical protein
MAFKAGGCHCGSVRFEADVSLEGLMTCNCSICGKSGAIMAFVPSENVRWLAGEANLTDYQFGKKSIHHSFCKTCGVRCVGSGPGHDGKSWSMVNVRCLDEVDVHSLEISKKFDGKNL